MSETEAPGFHTLTQKPLPKLLQRQVGMLENLPESSLCFLPVPLQSQSEGGLLVDAKAGYHVFTGLQPIWDHTSLNVLPSSTFRNGKLPAIFASGNLGQDAHASPGPQYSLL